MPVEVTPAGTRGKNFPGGAAVPLAMRVASGLYRLLGGRGMGPTAIVTTVGARTGQKRDVQLTAFPEGKGWMVVGSKGGSAKHPAWYINMARNPDQVWIQAGRRRVRVEPDALKGPDRAKAWKRIVSEASNFGDYQQHTDREIPVIRLTPIE